MHSILDKLPNAFSKLIGRGMPERIRSVGFAFLGLTAAAGLILVALFAQMGFPLLEPAPLPGSPEPGSVSKAVPLERGAATAGLAQAPGVVAPSSSARQADGDAPAGETTVTRVDESPGPVSVPAPGDAPDAPEPVAPPPAPSPAPAPTAPEASVPPVEPSPPVETPVASPDTGAKPASSTAVASKPEKEDPKPIKSEAKPVKTATPKSTKAKPSKPSKPVKSETAPAPEAAYVPPPAPEPAEKGKGKEEGGKKDK